MSEKEMDRAWYAAAKCQHVPLGACPTCIGASLAAAEERGRRAGIEEAATLHRLALAVKHAKVEGLARPCESTRTAWRLAEQRLIAAANALPDLAPRDSGKETVTPYAIPRDRK